MYVDQISLLYRQFCDEQDTTFMTATDRQNALRNAYEDFRKFVADRDPFFYSKTVDFTVANANFYALNAAPTIIMGPGAAAGSRLLRPICLAILSDTGNEIAFLSRIGTVKGVRPLNLGVLEYSGSYWLNSGTRTLYFDSAVDSSLRLWYMPNQNVDWTKETSGDNEYVDDLDDFHDIIAMLAVNNYYQVRDQAQHAVLQGVLQERLNKLSSHVQSGWKQDGANVVEDVYSGW
jgi:hypothetical protein